MPKKVFRGVLALNVIFQAGFSLAFPAGLFLLGGWFLTERCGFGEWTMVVAVVLGVLSGVYSVFRYILTVAKQFDAMDKQDTKRDPDASGRETQTGGKQ